MRTTKVLPLIKHIITITMVVLPVINTWYHHNRGVPCEEEIAGQKKSPLG